jgi:choline monooxygenase|tara:strand:+ start:544 stop:1719 length:1176 start_codon:yes stop_codon:yes gene_type:complete
MSDIYNIINKEKLDIVSKPIKDAHGLPNECYTSKEYTLIERKKLFEDKWMVIGVASSLPNVGDAKPVDILGMPILLVRGKDKKIRVFHNVCSHRGLKLVTKPGNIKNVIRCPYHSWSYNFDGELVATPHIGGMNIHQTKDFERSKSNLKEIRSYIWLDLIMININNNEMSFEEYIKPLSERWEEFWPIKDRELINHSNDFGYFKLNANCNWKFAIENYCESYHLPWVHPGLNSYSKIEDHYHIQGLPNRFAGQGTVVYNPRFEGKEKFPCFPNWPKNKENIAEYVALFPNVMLGIHKDHYYAYWLEPINHEFTLEHMELYYVGEEAANSKKFESLRKQNHKQWEDIQKEDVDIIQGMQIGRKSPVFNGGNFSPVMDNPTHHFHKWVAQNLI